MAFWDKKFKVRVVHFLREKYTVEYAYYRFIPNWTPLLFWFDQGPRGGTECWSTNLWTVSDAEYVARKIKGIADVEEYYKHEKLREARWKEAHEAFKRSKIPYTKKEF